MTAQRHSDTDSRATARFSELRILGAGTARLVANIRGSNDDDVMTFTVVPGPASRLRFAGPVPEVVSAGGELLPPPRVGFTDAYDNPVAHSGTPLRLLLEDARGGRSVLTAPRQEPSIPVSFPGVRVFRTGTGYRLVASADGFEEATSTPFTVQLGPVDAATSSLRALPERVPAGASARTTLRVQLLDSGGNPVVDAPVRLAVSGTGYVLVPESGEGRTDARGSFSATLASATPQVVEVTATAGGLDLETEVAFVPECSATTALPFLPVLGESAPGGSLLTVDLDGDGDLDAASSEGTLYDNAGDGTLVLRGMDPDRAEGKVAAGDLDGDGAPDLLYAGANVSVRFNRGDGSLFPPQVVAWGASANAGWLVDVNADGRLDVAYHDAFRLMPAIHVLLNQGGGVLAPAVTTQLLNDVSTAGDAAVVVSRGPGEGADVVALSSRSESAWVFKGLADGRFMSPERIPLTGSTLASSVADADGDGREDVFFPRYGGGLFLLRNLGQGTFAAPAPLDMDEEVRTLALADLDGDGRRDFVFTGSSSHGSLWTRRGDGAGGFLPTEPVGRALPATGVSVGDLTGDGRPELLVSSSAGVLPVLNRGDGTFVTPELLYRPFSGGRLLVGDFNGDSVEDVASVYGSAGLLLSQPDGTRVERHVTTSTFMMGGAATSDLDDNGVSDLIVTDSYHSKVNVLRGLGGGNFELTSVALDASPGAVASGDLDGDQVPEVVVLHPGAATARILRNDGTGSLQPGGVLTLGGSPRALALVHLDGDGDLDLVVADASGILQRFDNDGRGGLVLQMSLEVGSAVDGLAVGELDGNAGPEVVVVHRSAGLLTILPGDGGPSRTLRVGAQPSRVAIGDFNRDGRPDLAVFHDASRRLAFFLGQDGGSFSPRQWQGGADSLTDLVAHDWDGDGTPELLSAHSGGVDVVRPTCVR
ncbi:FG-GAP-like repeat-containing protein [Pyxidicoccus sp. 3LG]